MSTFVRITNPRPNTWYFNKKGLIYEVDECNFADVPCYVVVDTEWHMWSLFLSKADVEIVEQ